MKIPFVIFLPMEKELNNDIREAFDRVFTRSWYIEGVEDEAFEKAFAEYEKFNRTQPVVSDFDRFVREKITKQEDDNHKKDG